MAPVRKLFWTDLVNLLLFLSLIGTGIIIKYVLPPGSAVPRGGGRGYHGGRTILTLWSLDRHDWGEIHFWLAVAMLAALAIHLIQHRRWIGCQFKRQSP